jgi:hypothetical protein
LDELGYSLRGNRKTKEGLSSHPDRDQQFIHISEKVKALQSIGQPVIFVDIKKKKNNWRIQKQWPGMGTERESCGS